MSKRRCRAALSLALAFLLVTAACGGDDDQAGVRRGWGGDDPIQLTFGITPSNSVTMAYFVAEAQGFFADNGLEVEQVATRSGTELISGTVGGSFDFTISPLAPMAAAAASGEELRALPPYLSLVLLQVVRPETAEDADAPFPDNVESLRGTTLAVSGEGSLADIWLRTLLEDAGIDPDEDVDIIATGASTQMGPQLDSGQVDGVVGSPATVAIFEEQGFDVEILASTPAGTAGPTLTADKLNTFGVTTQGVLDDNPEAVERYCAAMEETIAWMTDPANDTEAVEILAESTDLPVEAAAGVWEQERGLWSFEDPTEEAWDENVAFSAEGTEAPYDTFVSGCG